MLTHRLADERGKLDEGWLNARYSFSFASYRDPNHMGFGPLRVLNDDIIAPAGGFPMHSHENFEIVSYILKGALAHEDSMGHKSTIHQGDIQHMSAGSGVRHSEFNPSDTDETRLMQIWFEADQQDIAPAYHQKYIDPSEKSNRLKLLMSQVGRDGSGIINQDIDFYACVLTEGKTIDHAPEPDRLQWVQLANGNLHVNGMRLEAGDGLAIREENLIRFDQADNAEFLLFDMKGDT